MQSIYLECPSSMIVDLSKYEKVKDMLKNNKKCGGIFEDITVIHYLFWYLDRKEAPKKDELETTTSTPEADTTESQIAPNWTVSIAKSDLRKSPKAQRAMNE